MMDMSGLKFTATTIQTPWGIPRYEYTPEYIQELTENEIFVYGDNLSYIHGAGAAKLAVDKFGAMHGVGHKVVGQSYGISTKDHTITQTLSLEDITKEINYFKIIAVQNFRKVFLITKIGCGLANPHGQHNEEARIAEIAPLFKGCPPNCIFPIEFHKYLK